MSIVVLSVMKMMQKWSRKKTHFPLLVFLFLVFISFSILYNEHNIQRFHQHPDHNPHIQQIHQHPDHQNHHPHQEVFRKSIPPNVTVTHRNQPPTYMPHLSLLYNDLSDEEKKKAQEKANILDESIGSLKFQITRLALYKTDPEDKTLKSWEKVAECDLKS